MKNLGVTLAIAVVAGFAGIAQSTNEAVAEAATETVVLNGKAAKKMMFSHKGSDFAVLRQDFMSDTDVKVLNLMAGMDQFKAVLYYGAIAASPSDGVTHKATVAASNHHSAAAAAAAAIAECNGLRGAGAGPKCVVVAQILPKKYNEPAFSLSASATVTLKKTYLRGGGPKAMAISPSVGSYGVAKGEGAVDAALATCAAEGAVDCLIVVQD